MLCYLLMLAGLCWERLHGASRLRDDQFEDSSEPRRFSPNLELLVISLVVLFAVQLAVVAVLAQDDSITRGSALFPLSIVDDRVGASSPHRGPATVAMLALVVLETLALMQVGRALVNRGRAARTILAAGASVIYGMALLMPALTSADMYSYSGYSLLGSRAYAPPAEPFPVQFGGINVWWHVPVEPAPYGPLWIAYNWVLLSWAPTLLLKFAILRVAGVLWLLVILRCIALQRVSLEPLALLALNPAIAFQFIANGHNDVVGVGLALLALSVAHRGPWFQAPLVIAAGLIKLPFVLLGLAMLRGPVRTRLAVAAVSLGGTAVGSALFGGAPYVQALTHHARAHAPMFSLAHSLVALYVLGAIVAALLFRRWSVVATLAFPSLAAAIFPWYTLWGLPYAVAGRSLTFFLIALPLANFLFDPAYDTLRLLFVALFAVCAIAGWELWKGRRRSTSLRPGALSGA